MFLKELLAMCVHQLNHSVLRGLLLAGVGCGVALFTVYPSEKAGADDSGTERVQPVYRPSDRRPHHDDAQLKSVGISIFESKCLKLYTDIDAAGEKVPSILRAVDAAYDALSEYFGPLPPAREKTEFQITGYLMADKERFRRAGLLPNDLPPFRNGRHRDLELWVNEQDADYYRRHLVIHEFTHCFMFAVPGVGIPNWYAEGMAELFGTHRIDGQGRYHFRVMPDRNGDFEGLGRIPLVRDDVARHRGKGQADLENMKPEEFLNKRSNTSYAWSWAECAFLDGHPRYSQRFRELGKHTTRRDFHGTFYRLFATDFYDLWTEWILFSHQLQPGYDLARAAIEFHEGTPLESSQAGRSVTVDSSRGWQSSGIEVRSGRKYEIVAVGDVTLANDPKPWMSQPQGISILYSEGRPIGTLLATVHRKESADDADGRADESMLNETVIGRGKTFAPATTGTLYFRINDFWDSLADNQGRYRVTVRVLPASPH